MNSIVHCDYSDIFDFQPDLLNKSIEHTKNILIYSEQISYPNVSINYIMSFSATIYIYIYIYIHIYLYIYNIYVNYTHTHTHIYM